MEFWVADGLISPRVALLVALVVFIHFRFRARWRNLSDGLPLPPGPKCLPYIGNVFHMLKPAEMWKAHRELCEEYGEHLWRPRYSLIKA